MFTQTRSHTLATLSSLFQLTNLETLRLGNTMKDNATECPIFNNLIDKLVGLRKIVTFNEKSMPLIRNCPAVTSRSISTIYEPLQVGYDPTMGKVTTESPIKTKYEDPDSAL